MFPSWSNDRIGHSTLLMWIVIAAKTINNYRGSDPSRVYETVSLCPWANIIEDIKLLWSSVIVRSYLNMISKVMFVVSHLVLGVGVFWSVIIQESGVISVRNAVTIISFALVSLLNFWIWMCPMDRIRNVRILHCKIYLEILKSKTNLPFC